MSKYKERSSNSNVTPMMQQYLSIKENYKDCLLFYRMGDFYEMFFEDALIAIDVLGIAMTYRGVYENEKIPMCGVPYHSYEPYLHKLIKNGYKVAICEQLESPENAKKRGGYKAVVNRDVIRVITGGTIVEENLLNSKESNYLASLVKLNSDMAIAWIDISTGEFTVCNQTEENMYNDLSRLNVKELLLSDKLFTDKKFFNRLKDYRSVITPQVHSTFDYFKCENKLKNFFGLKSLDGLGKFSKAEITACGSLIEYIDITQKGNLPRLNSPKKFDRFKFMVIDAATRRNLELTETLTGSKKGSFLSSVDYTVTGAGGRLLRENIAAPLTCSEVINKRLDSVEFFIKNGDIRKDLREHLKQMPDLERSLSRVCINKASPKDLVVIKNSLNQALLISGLIEFSGVDSVSDNIKQYIRDLGSYDDLRELLNSALKEEVGVLARDGNFICDGYHPSLDEVRDFFSNSKQKILGLRDEYRKTTGINSLKISQNSIFGFYIEVTPQNSSKINSGKFIHRQTLSSSVRYITEELKELEQKIITAKDHIIKLELMLFEELVQSIKNMSEGLVITAHSIAALDLVSSFSELAVLKNYTRPEIDNSLKFEILGGRHPVVEDNLKKGTDNDFIDNDCNLSDEERLWLLTGPNMAGKSTFLRQNALMVILAQTGSFVPAKKMHAGVVDRLFSRVGASDSIYEGNSTFMVEMLETSVILNNATERSFVILDEVGRGTATYDGLSIAWAVVEYLHDVNKSRGLFATHYHELTSLESSLKFFACYRMDVKEWKDEVIFKKKVIKGISGNSYGIYVAKLSGLPKKVTQRAQEILINLHKSSGEALDIKPIDPQLSFLNFKDKTPKAENFTNPVLDMVNECKIDELSPKEALDFLYNLKNIYADNKN